MTTAQKCLNCTLIRNLFLKSDQKQQTKNKIRQCGPLMVQNFTRLLSIIQVDQLICTSNVSKVSLAEFLVQ